METTLSEVLMMTILVLFYSIVISAILISFWKLFAVAKDITEIKQNLIDLKKSVDEIKR